MAAMPAAARKLPNGMRSVLRALRSMSRTTANSAAANTATKNAKERNGKSEERSDHGQQFYIAQGRALRDDEQAGRASKPSIGGRRRLRHLPGLAWRRASDADFRERNTRRKNAAAIPASVNASGNNMVCQSITASPSKRKQATASSSVCQVAPVCSTQAANSAAVASSTSGYCARDFCFACAAAASQTIAS